MAEARDGGEDGGIEEEPLVTKPLAAEAPAPPPTSRWYRRAACCFVALALTAGAAGLAWLSRAQHSCSRRRFAYATMITKEVGSDEVSPCYKAALALMLRSWLATNSSYPFILMTTADLDDGLRAIVDERPGAIIPLRVEQLQESSSTAYTGAMATKLNLWELGTPSSPAAGRRNQSAGSVWKSSHSAYDQIAYYDCDHLFLSNADRLFDECGCSQRFCGTWDSMMPAHRFPNAFGQPFRGSHVRQLVNAGMMVIQPEAQFGAYLREQWARRAEVLRGQDAGFVLTGSDQTWFNYVMGSQFTIVPEHYNLGHVSRPSLLKNNRTDYARFLRLDGTALDESVPTVVHTKPWLRGRNLAEDRFHRALLARHANPYIRGLLRDRRCGRDVRRPVARARPEDLRARGLGRLLGGRRILTHDDAEPEQHAYEYAAWPHADDGSSRVARSTVAVA